MVWQSGSGRASEVSWGGAEFTEMSPLNSPQLLLREKEKVPFGEGSTFLQHSSARSICEQFLTLPQVTELS